MNEAMPEGVGYEVHQSHGGGYWVPVIHGRTAADTAEQATALMEALRKKRFTDAPLLRIVKVTREVTEVRDFRKRSPSAKERTMLREETAFGVEIQDTPRSGWRFRFGWYTEDEGGEQHMRDSLAWVRDSGEVHAARLVRRTTRTEVLDPPESEQVPASEVVAGDGEVGA